MTRSPQGGASCALGLPGECGFVEPTLLPAPLAVDVSARALEALSGRLSSAPVDAVFLYDFDRVAVSAHTHLAEQFHILGPEGWESAASVEQRRALLKSACALHRRKGTKWSIVRALGILGLDADIEEWFEYGGEPHYFRVIIDGTDSGAPDLARAIRTAIEWKNARSHLEVVRIRLRAQAPVHISAAAQFAHTIHIGPQIDTSAEPAPCRLAARAGALAETIVSVYPARSFGRYDVSVQALAIPCVAGVAVVEQVSTGALQ